MEIKLIVSAEIIAVLKLFTAQGDIRRSLNGIALEIGQKESRLIATNGAMLGCFRVVSEQPEVSEPLTNIIIPNELLKQIKPSDKVVEITIGDPESVGSEDETLHASNSRPVTLSCGGVSVSGTTIDDVFPNYRKVIPSNVTGQPAQFDPNLIAILAKARSAIHGGKGFPFVALGYNGQGAALINLEHEDFVGVIMPLNPDAINVPVAPPEWVFDSLRDSDNPAADLV